jgi:hypothetical protein
VTDAGDPLPEAEPSDAPIALLALSRDATLVAVGRSGARALLVASDCSTLGRRRGWPSRGWMEPGQEPRGLGSLRGRPSRSARQEGCGELLGQPLLVCRGAPAAVTDERDVAAFGCERPDDVAGLANREAGAQGALPFERAGNP